MELNDDYNAIRGNILMMSPLPSISQVYSMLIQEEKEREIRSSGHFLADSASLAIETHKPHQFYKGKIDEVDARIEDSNLRLERNEGRRYNLFCNYCKRSGHTIDKCYRLHGFPPSTKFRGGRRTAALVQTGGQERTPFNTEPYNSLSQGSLLVPRLTPEQSL